MQENEIISTHREFGPKVYRLPSGEFVKVFYPKSGLTKRIWFPKYKTFIDNAKRLKALGFHTITVTHIFRLDNVNAYGVQYQPVAGTVYRDIVNQQPSQALLPLVQFIASLHAKGVFFRGMHLGNIVYDDHTGFGIIDMADLSFHHAPLRIDLRVRQWKRLFRYYQDNAYFQAMGTDRVLAIYIKQAGLSAWQQKWFYWIWSLL